MDEFLEQVMKKAAELEQAEADAENKAMLELVSYDTTGELLAQYELLVELLPCECSLLDEGVNLPSRGRHARWVMAAFREGGRAYKWLDTTTYMAERHDSILAAIMVAKDMDMQLSEFVLELPLATT